MQQSTQFMVSALSVCLRIGVGFFLWYSFSIAHPSTGEYFVDDFPARACYAVAGLPKNALIEIECVAVLPSKC